MKLKYQWFLGGRVMFCVSIILMVFLICSFTVAYIVDPITISSTITTEPDTGAIKEIAQKIVDAHPNEVQAYKNGKNNLLGFFVGQVMKETKGSANPKLAMNILIEELQ